MSLLFCFTSYVLNMFRILIYPSSGACDFAVELPHWSFVLGLLCVEGYVRLGLSSIRVAVCSPNTTQAQPHLTSNTQQTKNKTTNVVIQQHSRKLLMIDILISEIC